ncbi:hypothetical protein [Streptomyces sp. CCM_MD2014]|uniref:hypothetical protein n=1 Tax=Streptomyces sp. CCM_MD2014 TaxID=1561022 RepID=UPI00052A940E|nr:hypothetical protein [Streptomyces sp. CCM_MD2014]AIV35569.1 hypothetical protein NI25_20400 [Streptomyces sp. CCM_MD2014]
MTLTRADLPSHLGRWVTVANPNPHLATAATWYGRLVALSDDPTVIIQAPGGGQGVFPQAFTITPADPPEPGSVSPRRQAAYEAVYALIRQLGAYLPPDPAHRNAVMWRAVTAALDAANIPAPADPYDPTPASNYPPGATPGNDRDTVTSTELGRALEESHHGWALDLSPECADVMAERLLQRYNVRPRIGPGDTGDQTSPASGGHVHLPVPLDERGCDLTSGVPVRPHPEDNGDTAGDTGEGGVRFAYTATVRRGQVRQAITEAFDLLGAELDAAPHRTEDNSHGA